MNDEIETARGAPGVAVVGGRSGSETDEDLEPGSEDDAAGRRPRDRGMVGSLRRLLSIGSGGGGPGVAAGRGRRSAQPRWLVPVLLVVTAVSIVAAIAFGIAWSGLQAQQNTRVTVRKVASDFLLALTNFKPNTVDSDFKAIATYATGNFAKQSSQFFGSNIRQQLEKAQASSQGQLRYIYIQDLNGNRASVYAEVDQTYANAKVTTPQADVLQVALAMVDTSGGWKISEVSVLQPPSSPSAPTGNAGTATGGGG